MKAKLQALRVAVSAASFAKNQILVAELKALGVDVFLNTTGKAYGKNELIAFYQSAQADAAIVGTETIDEDVLVACPSLKFFAKYGVGLDNFGKLDKAVLKARGIELSWTGGVNKRSVAELVLAFMLGHQRRVFASITSMRRGEWVKDGGVELSGKQVGIVGFGEVGTEVAKLLQPFGCKLVYSDIVDRAATGKKLGAAAADFTELLRRSDVVTLHVPLTALTKKMLGTAQLAAMKPQALLINTARGAVVDFDAACAAVIAGRLGGFAADVFEAEPVNGKDLMAQSERIYLTPHIGGNAAEAVLAMGRAAIAGIAGHISIR